MSVDSLGGCTFDIPEADKKKNLFFKKEKTLLNNFHWCQSARMFTLYGFNKSFLFVANDANKERERSPSASRISEFDTNGFFRSHLQLYVYFTRLNINFKSGFCKKKKKGRERWAEVNSGLINYCLTSFLNWRKTEALPCGNRIQIEERAFRKRWRLWKCQGTLQATDWQSQKGESKSESDLAPRSNTRRGRLSAFQSLLDHDKWRRMRSVKRREIRNTVLPTEAEQLVWKINLWPREIECRGFEVTSNKQAAWATVTCGRPDDGQPTWSVRTLSSSARCHGHSTNRTGVTTVTVIQPDESSFESFINPALVSATSVLP